MAAVKDLECRLTRAFDCLEMSSKSSLLDKAEAPGMIRWLPGCVSDTALVQVKYGTLFIHLLTKVGQKDIEQVSLSAENEGSREH